MWPTRAVGRASRTVLVHRKSLVVSQQPQFNYASHPSTMASVLPRLFYGSSSSKSSRFYTSASPDPEYSAEVKAEDLEHEMDYFTKGEIWMMAKEKDQLLIQAQKEAASSKDTVLRTYAEMENVRERMRRESENAQKFAIQKFAKSMLDVADNLNRASSVGQESFNKIDISMDTAGAVPHLKTLLEGVRMTEKQIAEVFKKYGVEKFDPTNEPFDPNLHSAVLRVPDNSKPPDSVALVFKPGYVLHDRVLRPAEVGVVVVEGSDNNQEASTKCSAHTP